MKAAEYVKNRGKPAPSHPVTLRLLDSSVGESQSFTEAPAVFCLVSDRLHTGALDAANRKADEANPPASAETRIAMEQAHFLCAALRDKDAPSAPFFDGPEECRAMLNADERLRLIVEYQRFVATSYPAVLTDAETKAFAEDAKALFLGDLLSRRGYWQTLRALPSFARVLGISLTQ
jgi:hypothetical protein